MRAGSYQENRSWWTPTQRVVVLTFPDAETAEAWDDAGQPMVGLVDCCAELRVFDE